MICERRSSEMSTHFSHMLVSLALVTASAYCEVAQAISHNPPLSISSSSSSLSSPVAATTRRSSSSEERQNYEKNLLEFYKNRIVQQLGLNVNEDGAIIRPNGTSVKRPPVNSDIVNSSTPINISIDGKKVSGDRRHQSGEFQFELGIVKESTLAVISATVRVYVRRKSLAASTGGRRRRRFASVAVYRVTDEAVDRYPLAQMASRVRRGQPLELLLPTTTVDEALNESRPESRVLRLRIVCHQCRLDNPRSRPGRGRRHRGMTSQLIRTRRRGQQSTRQLPSLVISVKVKGGLNQAATSTTTS